jgi:phosphoribosylaminoimidazolecarboxamide formyltransferase/IMP cyclohydrolase
MIKKCLISVHDKQQIESLASELVSLNYEILATSGTAKYLRDRGFTVRDVSEITGINETREIKTLHPEIFRMIFAGEIGVVAVDLYPFNLHPSLDNIDIGGIALLRAAAKSYRNVVVLPAKEYYEWTVKATRDIRIRRFLAEETFRITSEYDMAISRWLGKQQNRELGDL